MSVACVHLLSKLDPHRHIMADHQGPVVQSWFSVNLRVKFNCFNLYVKCIPFFQNLREYFN